MGKMTPEVVSKSFLLELALLILMILTGCYSSWSSNDLKLAAPESVCQTSLVSWNGIIPGQSTKADVEKILGEPADKGYSRRWQRDFFIYPPIVTLVKTSYGNMIVFRDDNVVDWIDIWVSNSDGKFHAIAEATEQYGATLDQVYVSGAFDFFGPEQVYVWSECGIALTAVADGYVKRSEEEILPLNASIGTENLRLSFRHPVHPEDIQPKPNVEHIIVRKFLFQPTNFASFEEFYAGQIPYLSDNRFYRLD